MTIWIVLGAITLLVAGFTLWPLLGNRRNSTSPENVAQGTNESTDPALPAEDDSSENELESDLAVYRDQLSEIERDIERGVLTREQASAARIEVQRRILTADQRIRKQNANPGTVKERNRLRPVAAMILVLFLAGGIGLYADLGSPEMKDRPIASRVDEINAVRQAQAMGDSRREVLDRAVTDLSRKLLEDPDNIRGWELLGASLMALGRPEEAQTAFLEAVKLSGRDGDYLAMYAESVIRSNNGQINAIARGALNEAATTGSTDPRIQYYLGLGEAQDGNVAAAIDRWIALANSAPADASWVPMVVARINEAALAQGIDIEGRLNLPESTGDLTGPRRQAGPNEQDVRAAEEMTDEERQAMILSMVEGLAARLENEPEDADGWARLMRAYMVMGKTDEARQAYQTVTDVFAGKPGLLAQFSALANELGIQQN